MIKRWLCLSLLFAVGLVADGLGQSPPSSVQLAQLKQVRDRLLSVIPNPPQFELLVFDNPSINAGATSGRLLFSTGMLNFVRSDDELAVIVGHEIAHLTQGHVVQGRLRSILLSLASQLVDNVYPGVGVLTGQIGRLFLNHYDQRQEHEADAVGLRYAFDAGYDPWAGAEVMRRLAREVPKTATANFFSSHPSSPERANTLQRLAARLTAQASASPPTQAPGPAADLAALSRSPNQQVRSRFGRDKESCLRARSYFQRASDTHALDQKVQLYHRGLRLCPQSPRARFELAEVYARLGQLKPAADELRAVLSYDPFYPGVRQRLRSLQER